MLLLNVLLLLVPVMATSPNNTRTVAGITVLDTPLISKALAYARRYMDDQGFNHIARSWVNGQAYLNSLPDEQKYDLDLEAISIAIILHDLGWSMSEDVTSPDRRFEVDGADAAREFLIREGDGSWDKHRLQLVWDAIALHTTISISLYKQSEVPMTGVGIAADIIGREAATVTFAERTNASITEEDYNNVIKAFPKAGFKAWLNETFCGLARRKPNSTIDNLVQYWGDKYVEGYSSKGKTIIDIFEAQPEWE